MTYIKIWMICSNVMLSIKCKSELCYPFYKDQKRGKLNNI